MAAVLTHAKRMLRASLKKQEEKNACSPQKGSKRVDPGKDAEWWCHVALDKEGFNIKYISDYKGYGVFTDEEWKRVDFLLEYFGERISFQEAEERERKYVKDGMKMFYIFSYRFDGKQECIDATCTQGRLCHYVNDAYPEPPNCVMKLKKFQNQKKPRLCLFALRDVKKGEELIYDYGDETRNLWWRKKKNQGKNNEMLSFIVSDDDPFDLDKTYIPDASSADCPDISDEINISPHWFTNSKMTSDIANKTYTTSPPGNMDITASLDTNQAGMTNTVTISAISYTPPNEVDHLIDTTNIPPSDIDCSATNNTTNTIPCEDTTISTGIVNQAASDDTSSAPLSDIANMTNEADFHCVQCDRRFRTKGGFSDHVKSHKKVSTVYCKPKRFCKFCEQLYAKLKRHVIQVHKDCKEVISIIENPGHQKATIYTIRKEGIYEQNKLHCTKENPHFRLKNLVRGR